MIHNQTTGMDVSYIANAGRDDARLDNQRKEKAPFVQSAYSAQFQQRLVAGKFDTIVVISTWRQEQNSS